MTKDERDIASGRALLRWARDLASEDSRMAAGRVDPLDLAAYLDGRLDGELRARVEARLAATPEAMELLIASREALDAGSVAAPESLVRRASALAGAPERAGGDWLARLPGLFALPAAPQRALAFASVAAAFLLISVTGFELGRAEVAYSARIDDLVAREIGFAIDRSVEDLL